MNIKDKLLSVLGSYLDEAGAAGSSVDVSVVGDTAVVYIRPDAGSRNEVDDVSVYDLLARHSEFDDLDIEVDVIDSDEESDALEGAFGTTELEDDEEEEDELQADNLTLIEDDCEGVGIVDGYESCIDDEDDEYDDDELDAEDTEIDGIDEYEPSWDDLEEIMRERSDDYY